jgi:alpha-D-ribose 1-methylphosphonate 5-triphosphate synthase subunit PhnG
MNYPDIDIHNRSQWPRLLMALAAAEVRRCAETLSASLRVEDLQLPQSGLGLLKLRDSALGDAYFPGEIPLARARVRVSGAGSAAEGAAQILDDRTSLARAIAVLDAVLAGKLPGHEAAEPLLRAGAARIAQQTAQRGALLAATRVDFSLVNGSEEDNDD